MLEELYDFAKHPVYILDKNNNLQYRFRKLIKLLVISLCLSILLLMIASTLQHVFQLEMGKHAIDDLFKDNSAIVIFILAVIVAPFLEELLFRGPLLFFKNSKYFPTVFYSFTLIFGLIHLSNFELSTEVWLLSPLLVAPQIGIGFLLGFIRVKFGLVWSMTMHALYNLILIFPLVILKLLDIEIE
ncbi:CPBP family intramembrane glutamic endopeptidase [Maribacter sp. ACAM166]|uniref:CPBP family intramembrane glutamic endopeptidase n=1 Tax=Maribacter sp. ACAM166 TaxID=2508996 RepID=UPI0010FD51CD|nr:CPBP family intramembrane glutamic endopeptidase [Maribacter sp. ACAM166]TLP79626.1 CPBP family intramembrane metalloprotease [Maribacter sp. ACAM166]